MNTSLTRRIATAIAGPAVIAGVLGGALALGAPANAAPPIETSTCTTAKTITSPVNMTNLLTRPGQFDAAIAAMRAEPPTSCLEAN